MERCRNLIHPKERLSFGTGSILFLTQDPELIRQQVCGEKIGSPFDTSLLLPNINTDAIIPVPHLITTNTDVLGDCALCGLPLEYGIELGSLKKLGAEVLVAGPNFGIGSSREQAVWALLNADIKAIFASSFGKTFERNAAFLGLPISTNLELVDRIQRGEPVFLEDFAVDKDSLLQQVVLAGGLFSFLKMIRSGEMAAPTIRKERIPGRGMNIWEQRLTKAIGAEQVIDGDTILLPVDAAYSYEVLSWLAKEALQRNGNTEISIDTNELFFFEDHFAGSGDLRVIELIRNQRAFTQELGIPDNNYFLAGDGICHRVMMEKVDPRRHQVVLATDSHVPTLAALPVLAIPDGSTSFGAALVEKRVLRNVNGVIRVELTGTLPPGITAKDVLLELAATVKPRSTGLVVEYGGSGLRALSMDQVATLCNGVPEVFNAETVVTEPFEAGIRFLQDKFSMTRQEALDLYGMPEENCHYAQKVTYDLSLAVPWVALPGSPKNGVSLAEIKSHPNINAAYLVSCTLGLEDLKLAAAMILGRKVSPHTRLIVVASSPEIRREAEKLGIIQILKEAGATVFDESACAHCIGQAPGSVEKGEIAITASSRNFPGRMGAKEADVYMGSPVLTALATVLGRIPTAEEYRSEIPRLTKNLRRWQ